MKMLVFTNCLSETPDEGCLKVANSLIKKIKKASSDISVVSYERKTELSDIHVRSNKLLLTAEIIKTFAKRKERILYVPFPARSLATSLRVFILSLISQKGVDVLLTQVTEVSFLAKILFRIGRADFFVLSNDTKNLIEPVVGAKRVKRIKAGVDTEKFIPADNCQADEIRQKYGLSTDKPIVLHVGHMNEGRNVSQLLNISDRFQKVLVTSSFTKNEENTELKNRLLGNSDIKIIDNYIPEISELYRMSDVYFFPVAELGKCIDVPLSCLEAASCNKPIVTTDFGEMKEFKGKDGFFFIESFEPEELDRLINDAVECKNADIRSAVIDYDWNVAVNSILNK